MRGQAGFLVLPWSQEHDFREPVLFLHAMSSLGCPPSTVFLSGLLFLFMANGNRPNTWLTSKLAPISAASSVGTVACGLRLKKQMPQRARRFTR